MDRMLPDLTLGPTIHRPFCPFLFDRPHSALSTEPLPTDGYTHAPGRAGRRASCSREVKRRFSCWSFLSSASRVSCAIGRRQRVAAAGTFRCLRRALQPGTARFLDLLNDPKKCGAPGRTRTCDPRLRRPVLYPTELRARVGRSVSVASLSRLGAVRRCEEAVALSVAGLQRSCNGCHRTASSTRAVPSGRRSSMCRSG